MLVWLPQGALVDEIGPVPPEVRLETWVQDAGAPASCDEAEVVVLAPPYRQAFAELLPSLTSLRVVQTLNAGIDWVPRLPDGVVLCNASGVHDVPVAEWVVAVVLAMQKRLPHFVLEQRHGRWDSSANLAFAEGVPARDVAGSTALVVGHGSIGRCLQPRLEGLGMTVTGVARHARPGVGTLEDLPSLLPQADVVVLLAPATPETAGLVDAAFLDRMKPGALLVNAARGSLVDPDALMKALESGHVRAVLDATNPEPLPDGHPLWAAPALLVTPHVAGSSALWLHRAYRLVGAQLRRLAAGEPLENVREHGY